MSSETHAELTIDRCDRCHGVWFDAHELDAWLTDTAAAHGLAPEGRMPRRGHGSRSCPRCTCLMDSAGWTGLVLDRCPKCHGIFVDAGELEHIEHDGTPFEVGSFESRLKHVLINAGWTLLMANAVVTLIMRLMR